MKIYETLSRIGLHEQAVKIYLSLLENGYGNITDIGRFTDLHRAVIYRFLPILEERRLVSKFVSGKRTLYRANDPKHLKELLSSLESRLDIIIETLQDKQKKDGEGMFEYGKGIAAIQFIHQNGIDETPVDGTIYRYSSRKRQFKGSILTPEYKEKRKQKRIYRKLITNEYQFQEKGSDPMRDTVAIPSEFDLFDYDITKSIRDDTVAIVDYETLETFVIKNRQFAQFERKIFDLLFSKLKNK